MVIDNASQIFGVSNIILLFPSSRVHIAKVAVAVSLGCLLSCGGTAPLPHRRQLRHHVNDIDDTNGEVDSHDMIAMTVAGPEINTVAFHSIRVWETLMEGAVPLLEFLKTARHLLDVVECSDASFRDIVLATLMVIVVAGIHIPKDTFRKKCSTVALVRMNLLMLRKRDSSHWLWVMI
jgi:hypothetical protein